MTLSDLASLGSFVSGVAVLVTLVYLAIEIRQNAKHTRALISQARAEEAIGFYQSVASDPAMLEVVMRGNAGDETLDDLQLARLYYINTQGFLTREEHFLQHRAGLIDEDRHAGFMARLRESMRLPGYRASWKMSRRGYDPEFQKFMDDIAATVPNQPRAELAARWRALAHEEKQRNAAAHHQGET